MSVAQGKQKTLIIFTIDFELIFAHFGPFCSFTMAQTHLCLLGWLRNKVDTKPSDRVIYSFHSPNYFKERIIIYTKYTAGKWCCLSH